MKGNKENIYPVQLGLNGITGEYYCPNCWTEIKETDKKCSCCGQKLTNKLY